MVHAVIDRYYSLFRRVLKIFLNPRLSLIVPLSVKWIESLFIVIVNDRANNKIM